MSEADTTLTGDVEADSPGRRLAAAREHCGFAVADIARQLKLSSRQIEALEADNYSSLPGAVFVRGFMRNYARLVKLDPSPLLELTERQLRPVLPVVPVLAETVDIALSGARNGAWRKYAIAALVLIVPIIYGVLGYLDDSVESVAKLRQIELPPPAGTTDTGAAPAGQAGAPVVEPVLPQSAPETTAAGASDASAPSKPASAASPVSELRPVEHRVAMRFERESWVEIRDRHGRKIFSQINHAGTAQAVSGEPPLTLIVGNAAGVRVTHNDQLIDLAPHIKIDVARLTLE